MWYLCIPKRAVHLTRPHKECFVLGLFLRVKKKYGDLVGVVCRVSVHYLLFYLITAASIRIIVSFSKIIVDLTG